jgi:arginase
MERAIAVVGAPSSIGVRPYDDGEMRYVNRAPGVLRERGLVERLGAIDLGDVIPPAYHDFVRPPGRPRNEREMVTFSRSLAGRVAAAAARGRFAVVVGGDCSIVLGCLLGVKRAPARQIGLVYIDAHADFATPDESRTGSVASMCLALASGRGASPLARLAGNSPLVDAAHVALVGRRDMAQGGYGHAALAASPILDLPDREVQSRAFDDLAGRALARVAAPELHGFWIHLDADVLDPAFMSAVDSPEPGGLQPDELVSLVAPLVHHPQALGLSLAVYDPALDPDRSCARQLIRLLEALLAPTVVVRRRAYTERAQ